MDSNFSFLQSEWNFMYSQARESEKSFKTVTVTLYFIPGYVLKQPLIGYTKMNLV